MDKKKTIIAIVLFVFLGLMVFTFANPSDEETRELQNSENGNTTTTTTTTVVEENNPSSNRNNNVVNNNTQTTVDYTTIRDLIASLKEKVETATDIDMMTLAKQYNTENEIEVKVGEIADEAVLSELTQALEEIYKVLKDEKVPEINVEDGALLKEVIKLSITDDNEVAIKLNGEEIDNNTEIKDGIYELEVIDKAFNTTGVIRFTVDTVLPTGTVAYDETENTNKDVLVTITTLESVTMPEGWTKVDETTYTKTYSENTTETVTFTDVVGNEGTVEVKVENIDKVAPIVTYETSNKDERTNKDVTVTITVNEEVLIPEGWTKTDETTYTKVYSKNTTETITFTDLAGNTTNVEIIVKNVNKVPSKIESIVYSTTDRTNQDVTVTVTFDKAVYAAEGWTMAGKARVYKKTYAGNTEEIVTFKDLYGNTTDVEIKIANIDKVAPTATYELSNNGERTNQDVIVTITASEPIYVPEGWTRAGRAYKIQKTYSANTTEIITIKDLAGNTANVEIQVKDINKISSKIESIVYSTTNPTNQDVTVTVTFDKAVYAANGWTMAGKARSYKKTYSENTEEIVTFKDLYGNKTDVEINVTNIDKTPIIINGIDELSYIYDGMGVIPTTEDIDIKIVELKKDDSIVEGYELGTAIVNAGEYNLKVTDNAENVTSVKFIIEKSTPTIEVVEPSLVYNGEAQAYEIIVKGVNGVIENPSMNVVYKNADTNEDLESAPVNAGNYTLGIYVRPTDNYTRTDLWMNFTVAKATPTIEVVEPSLVYNGEAKEYQVIVRDANNNIVVEPNMVVAYKDAITGETLDGAPINAGEYRLGVYVRPNENYTRADKWINFTIEKATPTIELVEPSLIYNGEVKEYQVIVRDANNNIVVEPNMVVTYKDAITGETLDGAPINAGEYRLGVYVRPNENYTRADKWINFTIEKATPTIELVEPSLIYNGEVKEYQVIVRDANNNIVVEPNMVVTYKDAITGETLDGAPINAGEYRLGVYVRPNENYTRADKWINFTIEKATPTIELVEPSLIYNGEVKEYQVIVRDANNNIVVEPNMVVTYKDAITGETLDGAPINAGEYRLGVYVRPNENYTRADKWINFTIEKATPTIELVEPSLIYNGEVKEYQVIVRDVNNNIVIEPNIAITYKDMTTGETLISAPVNVGEYRLGIYVRPNENYTRADKWINFSITSE